MVCTSILTEPTSETATLAEFDRAPAAVPPDPEAISWRAAELVADLVEPVKAEAEALEKLGEGEQALALAIRWLRTKVDGAPVQRFSPSPLNHRDGDLLILFHIEDRPKPP